MQQDVFVQQSSYLMTQGCYNIYIVVYYKMFELDLYNILRFYKFLLYEFYDDQKYRHFSYQLNPESQLYLNQKTVLDLIPEQIEWL